VLVELRRFLVSPLRSWRSGTPETQLFTLVAVMLGVALSFVVSVNSYGVMPVTTYFVWLLVGMLTLRFAPLSVLCVWVAVLGVTAVLLDPPVTNVRISASAALVLSEVLVLYQSSRQRSGLPGPLSEAMFADLRDRLLAQGRVPPLPDGWQSQSAMIAAHGVGYGGDFMIVSVSEDRRHLEMILVDVCGKGVGAATQALQFGGALGGLVGALPPAGLFAAANDFLLRQDSDETFATAAHVLLDFETGDYSITSAGHPPALVWSGSRSDHGAWTMDEARGTALGVVRRPDLHATHGRLEPGQALMFYTDGVVESRTTELDDGIAWLQETARAAVSRGFAGAARRIVRKVPQGDDDRAVLILWREVSPSAAGDLPPAGS
jgi:hypothetical protein